MSLFYITDYPNESDDSLKGCYSSTLYRFFASDERIQNYDRLGLGGVFVADVMNVADLSSDDFMAVYRDLASVKLPSDRPDWQTDWQQIDKLFNTDPRFVNH